MAHQKLNRPQVRSGLQQRCREAVAESVCADRFLDPRALGGFAADVPDCMVGNRLLYAAMSGSAGEQVDLRALPSKILTQGFEQFVCHRYVAVARTLALLDVNNHALAVDIAHFQK